MGGRHANPWSVYTRPAAIPATILAIWSPVGIGWWVHAPVAAVIVWLLITRSPLPPSPRRVAGLGLPAWGLVELSIWPTVFGAKLIVFAQLWRIDRLGLLYEQSEGL